MQFSVIIPTLNEEHFLPGLLENLEDQGVNDFEVIIVDGNSEDNTKQLAKSFSNRLPIRILDAKKRNVSAQRNQGAKEAKGDYLLFLDADSRIAPHFMQRITILIKKSNVALIIPPITNDESLFGKILLAIGNFYVRIFLLLNRPYSTGGNMVIRKDLFQQLHGFDETVFISEDHDLVQRAFKTKAKIIIPSDITVKFSMRRISQDGWTKFILKMIYSSIYQLFHSKVHKPLYSYEMGGQPYTKKQTQ